MLRATLASLACVIGCGKQLNPEFCAAHPEDSRCTEAPDAADSSSWVAHLDADVEAQLTSGVLLAFDVETMIDTEAGTITPPVPDGVMVLPSVMQENGTLVMVIQAGAIAISEQLAVVGDKPLIFVANDTIVVSARLDVSGGTGRPGPGGGASAMGPGAGGTGESGGTMADGGGGGASFGTTGADGGTTLGLTIAGLAGSTYGEAAALVGGSGGGIPSHPGSCAPRGGGGGGAIQLTALGAITIELAINAGGGGGEGGKACGSHGAGGGGGGSGGMVFLESPQLLGSGAVAANGGGGGEGATGGGTTAGLDGEDGAAMAGVGGTSANSGGDGGDGATGAIGAEPGSDAGAEGNGGGGGGGAGRIYVRTTGPAPTFTTSPAATVP